MGKIHDHLVICDCGCGLYGSRFRMKEIKVQYHEDTMGGAHRTRDGRRFIVLAEHKDAFQRELNGLNALRDLVRKFENAYWFIRIFAMRTVYRAQFFILRRHKSLRKTVAGALKVAIVFGSPEPLQGWLANRWKPAKSAAPTLAPERPSEPSQAHG